MVILNLILHANRVTDYLISYTAETIMIGFTSMDHLAWWGIIKYYLKEWNGLKHYFFFSFFLFKTGMLNQLVVKVKCWLRLWRKIQIIEMFDSMSGQSQCQLKLCFIYRKVIYYSNWMLDVIFLLVRNLKISWRI